MYYLDTLPHGKQSRMINIKTNSIYFSEIEVIEQNNSSTVINIMNYRVPVMAILSPSLP